MIPLTATIASKEQGNYWLASVYSGLVTAIIAVVTALVFQREMPILYIPAFLLIGGGPVLGYQIASKSGIDWKPIIGGILGMILAPISFLIWPILVGALDKTQSMGKLFLASIIGGILGFVVFFILATAMGQNPSWIGLGFTMLMAVWGGGVGAAMSAWKVG